jgi:hypothetical protein
MPTWEQPLAERFLNARASRRVGALLVTAVALAACGGTHRAVEAHPSRAPSVVVAVDAARAGRVVPRAFLGLSVEWDSVGAYAGPIGSRSAGLRALLAPLVARTGGVALRVGGDTADQAWWNPRGRPRPSSVLQDVTRATLDDVAWLARGLRGPVTLDVNLPLGDPYNALALARAARRRLPRGSLDTLEIGNEPDLYTRGRVFHVPGHVHRRLRKRVRYDAAAYRRDVTPYLDVLSRRPPAAERLAVAGFAGPAWWPSLPGLMRSAGGRVGALSAHLYALPRCGGRAPPVSWLLTSAASRGRVTSLAPLVAIARAQRLPVRVTELNSAACGGRPRWSESFPAALWLTDTLFALLRDGVDQADVHTWAHARYAVFDVAGTRAMARPPLTAMLAFARAAPPMSRLIATGGRLGPLRAWATVDRGGTVRVALIARGAVRARLVTGRPGCAEVWLATVRGARSAHTCPRADRVPIEMPANAIAVVTMR